MSMPEKKLKIEITRNTNENLSFYETMGNVMQNSGLTYNELIWDFPVFASRQKITCFIERYELYKKIINIPGSIIEIGVAGGFGLMSFAHFCSIFEPTHYVRKLYGFDTFEGFSKPHKHDLSSNAEHMREGGLRFDSYELLNQVIPLYDKNRFLSHIPKVELIKGNACDTIKPFLKKNPSLTIAMLYLDADLYEPTKFALQLLRPRVPKGGIIVFDELNHGDYPGETIALEDTFGVSSLALRRLPFASMAAYAVLE